MPIDPEGVALGQESVFMRQLWGCSSAGRAPALHAGGQEFDPPHLHQRVSGIERTAETKWAHSSGG